MQLPTSFNLISGSLATAFIITIDTQAPLDHGVISSTAADFGYQGPGFYQILSLEAPAGVAVGLQGGVSGVNVAARAPATENTQNWLLADVGTDLVLIINKQTGGLLTTAGNKAQTQSIVGPYSPNAVWNIDTSQNYSNGAIVFKSAANGFVLDLQGENTAAETPIISYPLKSGSARGKNQAWLLQFLGKPLWGGFGAI